MCNLYSIRKPRDEVIGLFGISLVDDGVQLDLPAVYPDTMAPIIMLDDNGARNRRHDGTAGVGIARFLGRPRLQSDK
jgi:hypothetical protein